MMLNTTFLRSTRLLTHLLTTVSSLLSTSLYLDLERLALCTGSTALKWRYWTDAGLLPDSNMATFRVHTGHDDLDQLLRLKDGDVLVVLGSDVNDHLLLHSSVLKAASPFFEASMKACWTDPANLVTVVNPVTDEEVQIFKYILVRRDRTVSLQLKSLQAKENDEASGLQFLGHEHAYLSEIGKGIAKRTTTTVNDYRLGNGSVSGAVKEHQALFLFFHQVSMETWLELDYDNIANVVTYAELYQLLPYIAGAVEQYLLRRNGIWSDVRDNPDFHLGLAQKIRSAPLFLDALKHIVGKGQPWDSLVTSMGYRREEAALHILPRREELSRTTSDLLQKFQRLGLTPYIAHYNTANEQPAVGSTFLASGSHHKSTFEKATFIARAIFNEWMNQQLAAQPHWSHTRHADSDFCSGYFSPATLRQLCNAISQACSNETELLLFDRDAPSKYIEMFFREHDSKRELQAQISDALALLVRTASMYIQPLITPPPSNRLPEYQRKFRNLERTDRNASMRGRSGRGRSYGRGRGGAQDTSGRGHNSYGVTKGGLLGMKLENVDGVECARDDNGCSHFTCVKVSEHDLPWKDEDEWKTHSIDGLEDATEDWLDLVFSAYPAPDPEAAADGEQYW